MIISYATQAGRTAADGRGRNSPYTMAFLKNIEATDEIGSVFRNITSDVYAATESKQLPELSLSLIGNFYLKGRPEAIASAPLTAPLAPPTSEAERAWMLTQTTTSQAVLEDYIKRYADSFYGTLARARLDELKKSQVAVVASPAAAPSPPVSSNPCGGAVLVSVSSRSAQPLSAAEECALKPKDVFRECDKCPEMVVVPSGSFTMGSPDTERNRSAVEGPQHGVVIAKPFAVSKFHITVDQFAAFVTETGYDAGSECFTYESETDNGGWRSDRSWRNRGFLQEGSHPAVCLSWGDSKAYVAWLSRKTGKAYRLLTEAEWEYSARAGTRTAIFGAMSQVRATQTATTAAANGTANGPVRSAHSNPTHSDSTTWPGTPGN
jgi:formylglycine-generating enzyme required for sulfatase activity